MEEYLKLLRYIREEGKKRDDRTGTGTLSVFGYQARYDLSEGFPAVTTKKLYMRSIIHELLWFLTGSTNIKYLADNNVHIWDEWPYQVYLKKNELEEDFPMYSDEWKEKKKWFINSIKEDDDFAEKWGDLGPVYGKQWIRWPSPSGPINQIKNVLHTIKNDPGSRRMVVSGWNVADIDGLVKGKISAPPPCHTLFQFYVSEGKLSCQLYQRSADVFLGVPFNIASYSLLTMMMAKAAGLGYGDFVHTMGDAHLYLNHLEQAKEQLSREPRPLPRMELPVKDIFEYEFDDFELKDYNPHPPIKAPISV